MGDASFSALSRRVMDIIRLKGFIIRLARNARTISIGAVPARSGLNRDFSLRRSRSKNRLFVIADSGEWRFGHDRLLGQSGAQPGEELPLQTRCRCSEASLLIQSLIATQCAGVHFSRGRYRAFWAPSPS
jgi:hypothetical protein